MDELEQLRLKRLAQLQQEQNDSMQRQIDEEVLLQQQIGQVEALVKQRMSKEALQRFGNIKSAHPEKALTLLAVLAKGIESNQLRLIDDDLLKNILLKIQDGKKDFKIRMV